jgi:hypothetical protein
VLFNFLKGEVNLRSDQQSKAQARMGGKINLGGVAAFQVKWGKFICSIVYSNIHDFMFKTLKVFLM